MPRLAAGDAGQLFERISRAKVSVAAPASASSLRWPLDPAALFAALDAPARALSEAYQATP